MSGVPLRAGRIDECSRSATHCVIHFVPLASDELVQGGRDVVQAEAHDLQALIPVLSGDVGQVRSHLPTWPTPACGTVVLPRSLLRSVGRHRRFSASLWPLYVGTKDVAHIGTPQKEGWRLR